MRNTLSPQKLTRISVTCVLLVILLGLNSCGEQNSAGFCNVQNPGRMVSNYSQTEGTGCTEEEAKKNAERAYANEHCTGDNEPKCSEGCEGEQQRCQKTVKYVDPPSDPTKSSILECSSKADDSCPGGKKYTCKLRPTGAIPAECACACF